MGVMVFGSLGEKIFCDALDVQAATLERKGEAVLAANIQFAALAKGRKMLYAAVSDGGAGLNGAPGFLHGLVALAVGEDGSLTPVGNMLMLPERPIHLAIDEKENYVVVVFNHSGSLRVYELNEDGSPKGEVRQKEPLHAGVFTYQAIFLPGNRRVLAAARGNEAHDGHEEERGGVYTFSFDEESGQMKAVSMLPAPAGLGPRDFAVYPGGKIIALAMERGACLETHELNSESLGRKLDCVVTLAKDENIEVHRQRGGGAIFHPSGKFIYATNRADDTRRVGDDEYLDSGENNIAAYAVKEDGSLRLLRHLSSHGVEAKSLAIDPSGSLLVIGHQKRMYVREGERYVLEPINIALFRLGADGHPQFLRRYEMEGKGTLMWLKIYEI